MSTFGLETQLFLITGLINEIAGLVIGGHNSTIGRIYDASNGVINVLSDRIDEQTADIEQVISEAINIDLELSEAELEELGQIVDNSVERVLSTTEENQGLLNDIIDLVSDGVQVIVENEIQINSDVFEPVINVLDDVLEAAQQQEDAANAVIEAALNEAYDIILDLIGADRADVVIAIEKVVEAILTNKPEAGEILTELPNETPEGLPAKITRAVASVIAKKTSIDSGDIEKALNLLDISDDDKAVEYICSIADKLMVDYDGPVAGWVMAAAQTLAIAFLFPWAQGQLVANKCLAVWSKSNAWAIPSTDEAIRMYYRERISEEEANELMRMNGYARTDANNLIEAAEVLPSVDFILSGWLRGTLTDEAMETLFKRSGYSLTSTALLKELAFYIPPVQDLITMSVREVFSTEARRDLDLDEEFPDDPRFLEAIKNQGLAKEWAEDYWAAHWTLPSVQMGYEMFHRGEINIDELRALMKALDIAPTWRDKLINIAYTPITRVDIRRIHSLLDKDNAWVKDRYVDLGYSPDDAQTMADFVEKANDEGDIIDIDVASDLTRSTIIGFYVDGIIDEDSTRALLLQAGINLVATELFIDSAQFDIEKRERKKAIEFVIDQYRFDVISFDDAVVDLNGLGLETIETELAQFDLLKVKQQKTKIPSKADLDKFLKGGIIEDEDYITMLEQHGYSNDWANKYLSLIKSTETT
tara:strand:+ start:2869 stop:4980 length:2112 start_codon:yes stop_codon:yes gene_type:complete